MLFFVNRYTALAYAVLVFIGEVSPLCLCSSRAMNLFAWIEHGVASPASHTCDMVSSGIAGAYQSSLKWNISSDLPS